MADANPRELIKRMADEFECWIVNAEVEDIERAHNLVDEARAYLDQPEPEEEWYSRFADWLEREMPEGTVIGDPLWWASKIADYLARTYFDQPSPPNSNPMLKPISNGPIPPASPAKQLILRLAGELARLHDSRPSTLDLIDEARAYLSQPEPEATITEPRGCPTPGACSCPTAPYVPPELIRALELAEAALADISDTEREPWSEARAAQDLPRIRAVLARWGRPVFRQKELTDEQLLKCFKIATPCYNMEDWRRELDGMKAAIAADRALCARLAVEPAPVNELVDLAHELRKTAEYLQGGCGWAKALDAIERAAILIESNALRLIVPIPANKRLPGPEDCDKEQALLALSHLLDAAANSMDTTEPAYYIRRALGQLSNEQ